MKKKEHHDVIEVFLERGDILCLFHTGFGKSIIFHLMPDQTKMTFMGIFFLRTVLCQNLVGLILYT